MAVRRARTLIASDDGAVALVVVVLLVVFAALAALAVDLGYYYNVRRQLQAAADASALAACQELGLPGATTSDVNARAGEYAGLNAGKPADGLALSSVEVGSDYVQVTVQKQAPVIFGGAAGQTSDPIIHATSRAKLDTIIGAFKLEPWFLPVIVPTKVRAQLSGGGASHELSPQGGAVFSSGWNPGLGVSMVVAAAKGSSPQVRSVHGRLVDYVAANEFGVEERLDSASSIVVLPGDSPIDAMRISPHLGTAGSATFDLVVNTNGAAAGVPEASCAGGWIGAASPSVPGAGEYVFHGGSSTPGGHPITVAIDEVVTGSTTPTGTFVVNDAAAFAVREQTGPFLDIEIGPTCFKGSCGSAEYKVTMQSIDGWLAGDSYELKVGAGASTIGNFQGLDFGGSGGAAYRENVEHGYNGTVFLGQLLDTEPGNMTGPTSGGLNDRFNGDSCTYDAWLGTDDACPRIVYVPICEWTGDPSGKSVQVIVRGFAAFFVEGDPGGTATGRFIDYVASGIPGNDPPPFVKALKTTHLVSEGVTF